MGSKQKITTIELRLAALEASMRQVELVMARLPYNSSQRLSELLDKCDTWLLAESVQQKQIDDAAMLQHEHFEFFNGQLKCLKRNLDTVAERAGLDPEMDGFYGDDDL